MTIYDTLSKVKTAITKDLNTFRFGYEKNISNQVFFKLQENNLHNRFEVVLDNQGIKHLFPADIMYSCLFRGQQEEFTPCIPSIYRNNANSVDIFINQMRQIEFKHLLYTHPVVKGFYQRHSFYVDYTGLAQHYLIPTNILDFTNDYDIAIFFAICPYDKITNRYTTVHSYGEHDALIYMIPPVMEEVNTAFNGKSFLMNRVSAIGLQPLPRPGAQRGFALHLKRGEALRAYIYHFKYTKEDSEEYFEKYNRGNSLWCQDNLANKVETIRKQKYFSYNSFDETFDIFKPKGSKNNMKRELIKKGIKLDKHIAFPSYSDEEKKKIIDKWNQTGKYEVKNQICRRKWFSNISSEKDKSEKYNVKEPHYFLTSKQLLNKEIVRFIMAGPEIQADYINYNKSIPSKSTNKYSTEIEIPGGIEDLFPETYLTDEDLKLLNI